MHSAAFWLSSSGMLVGVAGGLLLGSDWWTVCWLWLLASVVLGVGWQSGMRDSSIIAAIVVLSVGLGVVRAHLSPEPHSTLLDSYVGADLYLEGVVTAEPDIRERSVILALRPERIGTTPDEFESVTDIVGVLVSVALPATVSYGDVVSVHGTLTYPRAFETDTGRTFDYPHFLSVRGIGYQMSFAEMTIETSGQGWWIVSALSYVRATYLHGLEQSLVEPHAALAGGITVGDKRALGGELMETFQVVGLSHIVVLSGYNITIVSDVIMRALSTLSRTLSAGIGGIVIMLFVLMSGASAAAVRAGIMACVVLVARVTHRPATASRALMLAVLGMIVYEPRILLYDPGFQLSVIATLGLIYVAPLVALRLEWVTERWALREIIAATIGTQLAVTPLLLYQTGLFSTVSLPVNVLVLPIIPAAMLFSFVGGVAGVVNETLGVIFGAPAYVLLSFVLLVAEKAENLPFSTVHIPAIPGASVILVYACTAGLVYYITRRAKR